MPPETPEIRQKPADAETLRMAALRASWTRDRRVARRRVALRWLAWAFWRYGLALLLVLAIAASLAWWMRGVSPTGLRLPRFTLMPAAPGANVAPLPSPENPTIRQEP